MQICAKNKEFGLNKEITSLKDELTWEKKMDEKEHKHVIMELQFNVVGGIIFQKWDLPPTTMDLK